LQLISVDELVNHKVLPFDIYNEKGKVIFGAGEILTPGKILQLKYIPALYIEDVEEDAEIAEDDALEILEDEDDELFIEDDEDLDEYENEDEEEKEKQEKLNPAEARFFKESQKPVISEEVKLKISDKYKIIMDKFIEEGAEDPSICIEVRDNIVDDIIPEVNKILYKSQLKIYGDYYYAHGVNVSMLSSVLAHKLKLSTQAVKDITLAAMLHDIGKIKIPQSILKKSSHTAKELKLLQLHPRLGYNIIKNELQLSESIARVALQHHERADGSGYPFGISGNFISLETHIVSICNVYDELTSGRGEVKVKNSKEAIKHILDLGTKYFKSDVLYTFVHMTNFNDFAPIMTDYYY